MDNTNESKIVDLCYLCDNYPDLPESDLMLPRDVEVKHLADLLKNNNIIFLDGKDGIGITTSLALFAKEHPFNCVSYFYDGFTKAWLSPDVIEESLVKQLGFYAYNDTKAVSYPSTKIQSLIVKISQRQRQSDLPLYFVFDGFHDISKEDTESLRLLFSYLPWSKARFIFSGKIEDYNNLIPSKLKYEQANCLLPFSKTNVMEYFKKLDNSLTTEDFNRLYEITQGEGSKIDYIKTKFRQLGSFKPILEAPDTILDDLYIWETETIETNKNRNFKVLLALIAFSTGVLTEELVCRMINVQKNELIELLDESSDYLVSDNGFIQYKSAAFRRYICSYLVKLKSDVEIQMLRTYEGYGFMYSAEMLPLYQRNKRDGIIPFLSATNVEQMHGQQQSHASLNIQYDYGFEAAILKEEFLGDAFRFAIAKSTSNEIEKNEIWDSEIEALIALGNKDEAIELAQSIYLKEDRLKALIQIIGLCDNLLTSEKEALKSDIDVLCDDIEFEKIPNKAIELAKLLLPVDFNEAMGIIDNIAKNEKNKINVDIIYAAISMSVDEDTITDSQQGEFTKFDMLKSKIKDKGLKEMTDVMKSVYADKTVNETLSKIKALKPASKQIYFLKYWIPEHKTMDNISEALEYAVTLLIDDSSIDIPKVSILCDFASALPYVKNKDKFEKIIRLVDSIEASIKTPTQEYCTLKLIVIESYVEFDSVIAKSILDDLYLYVSDLSNRSTRIDCLSQILSSYEKLGDKTTMANDFMTCTCLLNEIEDEIKDAFSETAYHFKIIQKPIKNLITSYPSFLKEITPYMNTEERRSKAYLYGAIEYIKQTESEKIKWSYLQSLVDSITYNEELAERVWMQFARKLERGKFNEDLLKRVKSLKDIFCNFTSEANKCFVLVHIYLWLYRNTPTDSFTSFIYMELYNTWHNIHIPWEKIDIGFNLAEIISDCNKAESSKILAELLKLKHSLLYSSTSNLTALMESIDLYTRGVGILIQTDNCSDNVIEEYANVISKLGAKGEEYIWWSKIAMNFYLANDDQMFKNTVCDKILNSFDPTSYNMGYRKHLIYNLAPVLFLYNSGFLKDELKNHSQFFTNVCISTIGRFLLLRYPYADGLDMKNEPEVRLCYNEALKLIDLTKLTDDEIIIFKHVENICKCIIKQGTECLASVQKDHIYKELTAIVDEKLPSKQGIQHNGYKIACKMALYTLVRKKDKSIWTKFENEISAIPNKADQAFLYFYALGYIDNTTTKASYLEKGYNVAASIKSGYDRFTRFNMCLVELMESYRAQFSAYYKQIALDLKGDNDTDLSYGEKMVDLAYQFDDERLVSAYMDIHDDDPVRIRYKKKLQKKLESTKRISNAIKQSDAVKTLSSEECDKCYSKQLSSLIGGKSVTKDAWDVKDSLYPIYKYSVSETKSAILYFMETVYHRQTISKNQTPLIMKMHEALLFNVKMVMALSTRSDENLKRIYQLASDTNKVSDSMIRPGEKSKAIKYIREWFKNNNKGTLQIIDAYFSPKDLLEIKPLFDIDNKLKVRILTHRKNYADINDYKDTWLQTFDEVSGKIDIVSVKYEDNPTEGPLHDRYWILVDKQTKEECQGITLNSISGLGNKESDISKMDKMRINDIMKVWNYYYVDGEDEINGHTLVYEKLYIE